MEERKPITHVTAGLIIAALLVVFSLIINFMGLTQQRALGLLQYALICQLCTFNTSRSQDTCRLFQ